MANKQTGNAGKQASAETDPWAEIEAQDIETPYVAVDSKWQTLTVVGIRKPTKEEAWKKLDGRDPFPVFAIIDVLDADGTERKWDVSSKLLLGSLRATVRKIPMEIEVKSTGKPPRKTYAVREFVPRLDVGIDDQDVGRPAGVLAATKYVNGKAVEA